MWQQLTPQKRQCGCATLFPKFLDLSKNLEHSQSAIALTKDGHYHARTKHIDIWYDFIQYIIEAGHIKLIYCPTHKMTADVLTKALPSAKVKHFVTTLGLAMV